MSTENDPAKHEDAKPVAEARQTPTPTRTLQPHELIGARTDVTVAKDPFYAWHEAAHAVTIDDKEWRVFDVNLDKRMTRAETKAYTDMLETVDWDDDAEVERRKPRLLDFVTTIVAGYVGERLVGSREPLVGELLKQDEARLLKPPRAWESDTDRTVGYLQRIYCNTVEDVVACEDRARDILVRRRPYLDKLAELLLVKRVIAQPDLNEALGKAPLT